MLLTFKIVYLFIANKFKKLKLKKNLFFLNKKLIFLAGGHKPEDKKLVHFFGRIYFFLHKKYLFLCSKYYLLFKFKKCVDCCFYKIAKPFVIWWSSNLKEFFLSNKKHYYDNSHFKQELKNFGNLLWPYIFYVWFCWYEIWKNIKRLYWKRENKCWIQKSCKCVCNFYKQAKNFTRINYKKFILKPLIPFVRWCCIEKQILVALFKKTLKKYKKTKIHAIFWKFQNYCVAKVAYLYWWCKYKFFCFCCEKQVMRKIISGFYKFVCQYESPKSVEFIKYCENFYTPNFLFIKEICSQVISCTGFLMLLIEQQIISFWFRCKYLYRYKYLTCFNEAETGIWLYQFELPPQRYNYLQLQTYLSKYKNWNFAKNYLYNYWHLTFPKKIKLWKKQLHIYWFERHNYLTTHNTNDTLINEFLTFQIPETVKAVQLKEENNLYEKEGFGPDEITFLEKCKDKWNTFWREEEQNYDENWYLNSEHYLHYFLIYESTSSIIRPYITFINREYNSDITISEDKEHFVPKLPIQARAHYWDKQIIAFVKRKIKERSKKQLPPRKNLSYCDTEIIQENEYFKIYVRKPIPKASKNVFLTTSNVINTCIPIIFPNALVAYKTFTIANFYINFLHQFIKKTFYSPYQYVSFENPSHIRKLNLLDQIGLSNLSWKNIAIIFQYKFLTAKNNTAPLLLQVSEKKLTTPLKIQKTELCLLFNELVPQCSIHKAVVKFQNSNNWFWSKYLNTTTLDLSKKDSISNITNIDLEVINSYQDKSLDLYEYTLPSNRSRTAFHSSAHEYFISTFSEKEYWLSPFANKKSMLNIRNNYEDKYSEETLINTHPTKNIDIEINALNKLLNEQDFCVLPIDGSIANWLITEEITKMCDVIDRHIQITEPIKTINKKDVFTSFVGESFDFLQLDSLSNKDSLIKSLSNDYSYYQKIQKNRLWKTDFFENQPFSNKYQKAFMRNKSNIFRKLISDSYIIGNPPFSARGEYKKFEKEVLWKPSKCPLLIQLIKKQCKNNKNYD